MQNTFSCQSNQSKHIFKDMCFPEEGIFPVNNKYVTECRGTYILTALASETIGSRDAETSHASLKLCVLSAYKITSTGIYNGKCNGCLCHWSARKA